MVPDDEAEQTARTFAERLAEGSIDEATRLLTADGRTAIAESFPDEFREGNPDAEDVIEQYRWGLYGQYGEVRGIEVEGGDGNTTDANGKAMDANVDPTDRDDDVVTVAFEFADVTERATIRVGEDGVEDASFSPEYEVPEYVDESSFEERDVAVDAGDITLPGVITVPDGPDRVPGAVLVHGAGITDPDGTVGASKILKDLAWGLASEGIATLRYERRLATEDVPDEEFTIDTVVADDAAAAVDELHNVSAVAEDAVFVVGHSQGGMCAPRVATRRESVAGVAILDGPADPTALPEDLGFMRYSFEPDGDLDDEQEAQLEARREDLRRIEAGDFADDETLMGRPGFWFRDVREYDPAGTASALDRPVFVAKTGRADPEVQPELVEYLRLDFERWQDVDLGDDSRVEFYEDVDHYFQAGPTPTTMDSLYFGGNVEGYVVSDLAEWITDITATGGNESNGSASEQPE